MGTTILTAESYINGELQYYNKQGWVEQVPPLVNTCYDWYIGYVKSFHDYYIKTGDKTATSLKKLPLYMAKKVAEDWANLLINEKCDIVIPQKDLLDTLLLNTNSWVKLNQGIEKSFALGYGAIVQGVNNLVVNDNGEITDKSNAIITNDFVPAIMCRPLTFNNGEVEDIAFIFENTKYIKVIIHIKDNRKTIKLDDESEITNSNYGNYDIINVVARNLSPFTIVERYVFNTNSPLPLFQMLQPNLANNNDITSPLGISVYGNAIECFKAIDNAYDSLNNEIQLGRKRVVADYDQYTEVDENGNKFSTFDPNDALIYSIPKRQDKVNSESKQLLEDISGELRTDAIIGALNQHLNILSSKVGMGENYYRFTDAQKGVTTATQVISENSTLFRTMKKHEILIEQTLKKMVQSLIFLNNNFTSNPTMQEVALEDIEVQFDDSIIEDTQANKNTDRNDVTSGVLSKVEYRMKYYGEDEGTAVKNLLKFNADIFTSKAEQLKTLLNDGLITPEAFVKLVYGDYGKYIPNFNEADMIAKVTESVELAKEVPSPFDNITEEDEF